MVIIISYNKQTWNEYNDNQTTHENLANGAIISADKLNHMETGISNNDTNKVNVSDMRKPANDVAGIEEVNAKQDKIGYTPADDSKVVHDNKNGTEQLNGVQVQPFNKLSDTIGGRNLIVAKTIENNTTLDGKGVPFGYLTGFTTDYIPVVANQKYTITIYDITNSCTSRCAYYDSSKNFISRELDRNISTSSSEVIVIPSGASYIKFSPDTPDKSGKYEDNYKFEQGSIATDWTPAPEDKADDSKVVHNTGTEEIGGQKTFDIAPIDKMTGNPYITKDGVPSLPPDLARTGQDANFTGKLQKSGIDVATKTDVTNSVNTATSNFSKFIEASKNDKDSAISDSTKGNSDAIYYWTKD